MMGIYIDEKPKNKNEKSKKIISRPKPTIINVGFSRQRPYNNGGKIKKK